jgi:glutamine synthetase
MIDEDTFADGMMFDGSSIAGWKAINESDMCLMPDPAPRASIRSSPQTTLVLSATCSSRPPASPTTATRAASPRRPRPMVKSTGIGDTAYFGPEAEFFVFDDVRFKADPYNTGF